MRTCGRYTMVSGTIPFTGETIYVVYAMIERCEYEIPTWFDADLADLIRGNVRCWCSVADADADSARMIDAR